jgi:hypothetical protein
MRGAVAHAYGAAMPADLAGTCHSRSESSMSTKQSRDGCTLTGLAAALMAVIPLAVSPLAATAEPTVITLTQVGCQFIESEGGVDRGHRTTSKADCESINARTGEERLATAKVLELAPGEYLFRVTNKNVPYGLGFWLRGDGLVNRARLPSVSGGGLDTGVTQDYQIVLKPGEYVYSCPLNPTPDYKLVVKG